MDRLFEYAIESAIALAVLYLFYWVFLRNDTHFRNNRFVTYVFGYYCNDFTGCCRIIRVPSVSTISFSMISLKGVSRPLQRKS